MNKLKTPIKRTFVSGLMFLLGLTMLYWCFGYPVGLTRESEMKSPDEEEERWLSQWRIIVEQENQLYLYAVKLFSAPVDCKAEITDRFEGKCFGTLLFIFRGGNELKVETFPSESSRIILRVPGGFSDEREACSLLEQYVTKIGVRLD